MAAADKNGVVADDLNILPADAYSFSFSADAPEFRSAENDERSHPPAALVNLNVAYKPETATVGFVNNLLAAKLSYAAIHNNPPFLYHYIPKGLFDEYIISYQTKARNNDNKLRDFQSVDFRDAFLSVLFQRI